MRQAMAIAAFLLGTIVVLAIVAVGVGTVLWHRSSARMIQQLDRRDETVTPLRSPAFSDGELSGLPSPVARYFRFALTPRQPLVRRARLTQTGEFALRPDAWRAFTAAEHFSVSPPGFVWDASIRMAPLLVVRVRDGYVAGEGVMSGKVAGVFSVVDQHGTPEMASGELMRFLAEAVWFPTALLPSAGVRWDPMSDTVAKATLTHGRTSAALDVYFGAQGEIVRVATLRFRDVNGTPVLTPWVGHFADYRPADGMMIPMSGAVEWVLPDGPSPYWRGRIATAVYEFWPRTAAEPATPAP